MTLSAIRYSMVDAILREPGNPLHRYALADSYEEVGDAGNHTVEDLRMDSGMWLVRYRRLSYRLLWVSRVQVYGSMPACFEVGDLAEHARSIRPAINLCQLPKAMIPECYTAKQIPADGRCRPLQRIASRHSGWRWCCPAAYVRIGAPCVQGIYLA